MRLITIPQPVPLTTLTGQPVTASGSDGRDRQITVSLKDYLLGTLTDPVVTKDLKGIFASQRLLEISQAIQIHGGVTAWCH
jgi:hypothetical protein